MKRTYATHILILLLAISVGFFNVGTNVSADATTTFQTGDRMTFFGSTFNNEYGENSFTAYIDPENNGTFFLGRDEYKVREFNLDGNSTSEVFVIRNERGYDTLLLINSRTEALAGSFFNETSVLYDSGPDVPPGEGNYSYFEDISGRMWHDFNREASGANATYAYLMPEFFAEDFTVPGWDFGGEAGFVLPDLFVDVSKSVSTGSDSFFINGQNFSSISVNIFTMHAFGTVEGTTEIPIDTPDFSVNATLDYNLTYVEDFEAIFDATTGIPLAFDRSQEVLFDGNFSTGPVVGQIFDEVSNTFVNVTFDMSGDFTFDKVDSSSMEIGFASSHYGLARPVSNGDPPLKENDVLTYDWGLSTSSEFYAFAEGDFFDENGAMVGTFKSEGYFADSEDGSGTTSLEVFRHYPDAFEALIWTEGNVERHSSGENNFFDGVRWTNESFTEPVENYMHEDVNPIFSHSNDSFEIWVPSPSMVPNPIFDGGKDGGDDGFLNDIFGIPIDTNFIPRDLPRTDMTVTSETHTYEINGFTFTLEVDVHTSTYEVSFNNVQNFDMYQITVSGSVILEESMVYDPATGVLLERNRDVVASMDIQIVEQVALAQDGPAPPPMHIRSGSVELDAEFSDWNVLRDHPHEYLEAPPEPTTPTNDTTSNVTDTTEPVNDTSIEPSFENPLPGFEWAAPLTVFATLVILRKRRN